MAPKRKASATTASVAKGEVSAPKKTKKAEAKAVVPVTGAAESSDGKNLAFVIEAWATKLEKALKEAIPGAEVTINPEKPRKGCFEVRSVDGTKTFVSLLDMPRPFTKLKALDIDELAKEIAAA